MITVIVLLGILSTVALSRFVSPDAFAPSIVTHAVLAETRFAQQLAVSRRDAVVSLNVDQLGSDWRFRTSTDLDGVVRTETVAVKNTSMTATSGATTDGIDSSTALVVQFDAAGDLESIAIGVAAGDVSLGVNIAVSGDSNKNVCIYPTGYTTDAACS
ncbi:MAG: hypothetical protein O7F71_03050 [Gammaproteobacteria bacterium]|nr:hypothetical protein [Gammaproteobacteria bacterium]